jgi:hypothetical protein
MLHARATEVLVCYSLVAAAALVVECGRVVLDAPRPRSQPAEGAKPAVIRWGWRKHG